MKREAKALLGRAIDSLVLSVEHFNRPWNRGRPEAVLILLDRGFELLFKAAIILKGGRIRERNGRETIGFDKCVRKCVSEERVKCLTEDQAITPQVINSLRDAAQHHLIEISERQLYLCAQAGLTLFAELLHSVFGQKLSQHVPERVVPISTKAPGSLEVLMESEFQRIKELAAPGKRKGLEAQARIRSLATIEASLRGERLQPDEPELKKLVNAVRRHADWRDVFPGIATLNLETSGEGTAIHVRITKNQGEAVHLVPEGTPGATVVAIKRVNELGFYTLGLRDLARLLPVSEPKVLAVIRYLKVQESDDFFKEIPIGKTKFKRYSPKALALLKAEIPKLNIQAIWKSHGAK